MSNKVLDQSRASYFDELADKWDLGRKPPTTQVKSFIARLNIQTGDTVLDIGTGTGLLIPYIFEYNPAKVVAIDLSVRMLQKLTEKFGNRFKPKLVTHCSDVHNWDLQDQFAEVAICNGVYPHFHDEQLALSQIFRVLRPGGVLAINHFNSKDFINLVHAGINHELICQDLLKPVAIVADTVRKVGFTISEVMDDETQYCLIAKKD
ncbi:MAG TPA: class I SAM-dependent methyltransferase [Bacillota bacterium]|nr:class I SAM-dependent methyltransferase [Bacillota bacterium]